MAQRVSRARQLRVRQPLVLAATAGLVLAAAGCGDESGAASQEGRTDSEEVGDLQVLVATGGSGSGGDARVIGEIAAVGDCVGLKSDGFTELLVWPEGTGTSDGRIEFDGDSYGLGDQVDSGGEYLSPIPDIAPEIPTSCAEAADDPTSIVLLN